MELILNDRSLHGQFPDIAAFQAALDHVLTMRESARSYDRGLQCRYGLSSAPVTAELTFRQAINSLNQNAKRSVLAWLSKSGPFWEDDRQHGGGDWLECQGEIVTDSGVGEAAYCLFHHSARGLVSFSPSSWLISPLPVEWHEAGEVRSVDVPNYWEVDTLRADLEASLPRLNSWEALEQRARSRYQALVLADDCFAPLRGHPFGAGAADRILALLGVLNELKQSFNAGGERSPEGHALYQRHFTGDRAWFSDSSETEKSQFESDLTFRHPANADRKLFCTWHGKVSTSHLRIHFSSPIRADTPLYVVYVGPKITKR